MAPDGKHIEGVACRSGGEARIVTAKFVVLAAGAVKSVELLLRSARTRRRQSQRRGRPALHESQSSRLCSRSIRARSTTPSIRRRLAINDFYLGDGAAGRRSATFSCSAASAAPILKAELQAVPEFALNWVSAPLDRLAGDERGSAEPGEPRHARRRRHPARLEAQQLVGAPAHWSRKLKERLRAAGYPIVLSQAVRSPHALASVRHGAHRRRRRRAPLDPFCRAWDHPNLFVVDASFLPTSAAVNPSLTIAAQALRVADHIARNDLSKAGRADGP